eukprot:TRINITY_DN79973_c0_g1_i1.p1 TRINITY_DN79973_c0_g1~~TRINITY_DN79973_c0_g1_i1.p1  ORF type:complete len:669 (-),score=159.85 TRINITY_DN79973_c0_g1_i1:173-2179(-)
MDETGTGSRASKALEDSDAEEQDDDTAQQWASRRDSLHRQQTMGLVRRQSSQIDVLMWRTHYDVADHKVAYVKLSKETGCWSSKTQRSPLCYKIAEDRCFQALTGLLIVVNVAFMSYNADLELVVQFGNPQEVADAEQMIKLLFRVEYIFIAFFVVECLIRMLGCPGKLWKDAWLVADTCVTVIAAVDQFILFQLGTGGELKSLKVFRCLRAFRVLRALDFIRVIKPMRLLVETIGKASAQTLAIILMGVVLAFACGIVFTGTLGLLSQHVIGDKHDEDAFDPNVLTSYTGFDGLLKSTVTLTLVTLRGIKWGPALVRPLLQSGSAASSMCVLLVCLYAVFMMVCFMSLVYGIFVGSFLEHSQSDAFKLDHQSVVSGGKTLELLRAAYAGMEDDGDGILTWEEFQKGLLNVEELLIELGIVSHQAEELFMDLADERTNAVNLDEFLVALMKAGRAGDNLDTVSIDYQQRKTLQMLQMVRSSYDAHMKSLTVGFRDVQTKFMAVEAAMETLHDDPREEERARKREARMTRVVHKKTPQSIELEIEGSHLAGVWADFEKGFSGKSRMDKLRASVDTEEFKLDPSKGSNLSQAAPASAEGRVWQSLLVDEVMPWFQQELTVAARLPKPQRKSLEPPRRPSAVAAQMLEDLRQRDLIHGGSPVLASPNRSKE